MLQRIEACPSCRGTYTGYVMYILQAATQAIKEGDLWLCYGSAVEEVCGLSACFADNLSTKWSSIVVHGIVQACHI